MPCYSYTTNSSVLQADIEAIHAVSGAIYSYSQLDWICEFPEATQFKVYTRPSALGPETLMIRDTHYTVQVTPTNTITFVAPHIPVSGQVVIRRKTPTDKMLYAFTDGAKLTATQLNESFTQLLFAIQENIFTGTSTTVHHTLTTGIPTWVANTSYVVNSIVTHNDPGFTRIFRSKTIHSSALHPEADPTNWDLVTPSAGGFTVLNGPPNIVFDLTGFVPGHTLLWNGTQFVSGQAVTTLDSLSDVAVSSAALGQILRHNGANWVNISPNIDITEAIPLWNVRPFFNATNINTSFTNGGLSISAPAHLFEFRNTQGNWVVMDPITTYRVIAKSIPSSNIANNTTDPLTFFTKVNNDLLSLAANISNPVKIKLQWDLSYLRFNHEDFNTPVGGYHLKQQLHGRSSCFWDSYSELYSVVGYDLSAAGPLKWHGVQVTNGSGNIYRTSPYFYQQLTSGGANTQYISRLSGYGIRSFYLSVPECHTSCLAGIPAVNAGLYYTPNPTTTALNLRANGDETVSSTRDYYLTGLRDMAFAGLRMNSANLNNTKNKDIAARFLKGLFLDASYDGLETVTFSKLEQAESPANVLWKIPRNIIYYNKAALTHGIKDTAGIKTDATTFPYEKTRFTGHSKCYGGSTNPQSTTLVTGSGYYYKADKVWSTWCDRWLGDADQNEFIRFNEADIDWIGKGMSSVSATALDLYRVYAVPPPSVHANNVADFPGRRFWPWHFRPNEIRNTHTAAGGEQTDGFFGTHMFNIDANKLFSEATNFLPDLTDEYVFRVVAKKALTSLFVEPAVSNFIKSAIIVEYGFSDSHRNHEITGYDREDRDAIFFHGTRLQEEYRVMSRLNRDNVKVYIKNETIETSTEAGSPVSRYVITFAIRVPRLKSIGYAKVFRKWRNNSNEYPSFSNVNIPDIDADSGPWSFPGLLPEAISESVTTTQTLFYDAPGSSDESYLNTVNAATGGNYAGYGSDQLRTNHQTVAGRNECAVKFTRLGIPSNLWIKLSVLTTEGVKPLIDQNGFIATNIQE